MLVRYSYGNRWKVRTTAEEVTGEWLGQTVTYHGRRTHLTFEGGHILLGLLRVPSGLQVLLYLPHHVGEELLLRRQSYTYMLYNIHLVVLCLQYYLSQMG